MPLPPRSRSPPPRRVSNQLNHDLEQAIERYNDAELKLLKTQDKLTMAKAEKAAAERDAAAARTRLSERAVAAYTAMGNQIDGLLGADNFSEFSDQLEFMGAIAQSDAELAAVADTAGQRAEWAANDYAAAVGEAKQFVAADAHGARQHRGHARRTGSAVPAAQRGLPGLPGRSARRRCGSSGRGRTTPTPTTARPEASGDGGGGWDGYVPDPNLSGGALAEQTQPSPSSAPSTSGDRPTPAWASTAPG